MLRKEGLFEVLTLQLAETEWRRICELQKKVEGGWEREEEKHDSVRKREVKACSSRQYIGCSHATRSRRCMLQTAERALEE